jgi:hypothetical protein
MSRGALVADTPGKSEVYVLIDTEENCGFNGSDINSSHSYHIGALS